MKLFHKVYSNHNTSQYVFILHGLFGMLDNWHNMARKLSEHFNVVTLDQRNHGRSPHIDEMNYELMAEDLSNLMNLLQVKSAHVIGHSMGGKTAMKFADLYPDRIEKLVVVDIGPRRYKPGHKLYFNAFNSLDFSECKSRKYADKLFAAIEKNLAVRQFLLKNLEKAEKGYKLKFNLKPIDDFYLQMIDNLEFNWLINNPTLFLYGKKSDYITEEDIHTIEDTFTQATFVGIEDAGHWVHAEKPIEFYTATSEFLQK